MSNNKTPNNNASQLTVTDAIVEFFKNNNKPASNAEDAIALIELLLKAAENELKRNGDDALWMQYVAIDNVPVQQTISVPKESIRICFGPFKATDPDTLCNSINLYEIDGDIAIVYSLFPPSCVSMTELNEIENMGIYAVEIACY